jgi:2-keto-4-pentenoate hydratase/2-oxohepta-3-ene-1,7-dioic acid hydratase in catechol pathway
MTRYVRFSLDRTSPATTREALFGILDGEVVYETPSLWSEQRGPAHPLSVVRLLPPSMPSKIVCVGRNYQEHAKELGNPVPAEPIIFLKPPSSLIATGDAIVFPSISEHLSYEGELGLVIRKRARNVRASDAEQHIFGYTCINDVTARDLQKKDGQWTRGKGFDTFCPAGPWIVTRGEVAFDQLRVRTFVDGALKQDGSVLDMIFPVPFIIEYVSRFLTLEPGDLVATGTPPGVGSLQAGSTVRVEIEGVGAIENPVVKE